MAVLLSLEILFLDDDECRCKVAKEENKEEKCHNGTLPVDHVLPKVVLACDEKEEERVVELEKLADEDKRHECHETSRHDDLSRVRVWHVHEIGDAQRLERVESLNLVLVLQQLHSCRVDRINEERQSEDLIGLCVRPGQERDGHKNGEVMMVDPPGLNVRPVGLENVLPQGEDHVKIDEQEVVECIDHPRVEK